MREAVPTKTEALALIDERKLMRDGFGFLDERRVLLATEILRLAKQYEQARADLDSASKVALASLVGAVARHGLEDLQIDHGAAVPLEPPHTLRSKLLGVQLIHAETHTSDVEPKWVPADALDPSPEAARAGVAFARLAYLSCLAGVLAGNLLRLAREYRRTDRRAKVLENVLMPEVETALKFVVEQLDTLDQEEIARARMIIRR